MALIIRILALWMLVQTTFFQNWLVGNITSYLSKDLQTTVQIKHVNFELFTKVLLEGTLIKDRHQDTLLYAGALKVDLNDWFFLKDKIELRYIGLENATVYAHRHDSTWNYQFLIDYFSSPSTGKKKKNVALDLKELDIQHLSLMKNDEWRGENQALILRSLHLNADQFDISNRKIHVKSLAIDEPIFSIFNYVGNRPPVLHVPKVPGRRVDSTLQWNPDGWNLRVDDLSILNGAFKSDKKTERAPYYYFDGSHILFGKLNGHFKNLQWYKDSITASINLSTVERSGFDVKSLKADFKLYPEAMEFAKLDIVTLKSHLKNYFSMRFDNLDDLSDFEDKVTLEGHFDGSSLNSDDIAYFAPDMQSWKKQINITGIIKGGIGKLTGKSLEILAGKNTYLNGDIRISGLPDIEKSFIEFKAKDFRTTYQDAITFAPSLKTIRDPKISAIQRLKFSGYFTGYIRDFVTSGTIETNLGTIVTDINMKLPAKGLQSYAGKINTSNFQLGTFLDNNDLGNISFNGKIKGSGFAWNSLVSSLDGKVNKISFKNYEYHDISVKGNIAKRLFNGELVANDPVLGAKLDGLIDFRGAQPRFDFTATVDKANLRKLNFTKDDIDFNGQFRFNFSGDNIDNFLGSARIYNAAVFKNGKRISFDSLTVESKMVDNSKSIIVWSNEFDAALVGEFSIKDLPSAFQTFLNRYYPSYINPSTQKLKPQNFSFVITTKNVDEYLDLLDKHLTGFNNSNLSGRINSKENLFDLDADVPKFSYRSTSFSDVVISGRGNMDTLSLTGKVGDIFVNDSLHFPGTEIGIRSSNDLSEVNIKTSANQTLNAATISGQVQTLKNGVRIKFNPSTFEINSKKWAIDKGGELILSKELVTTDGIRIYSGDQQIYITSMPSETGNTNDLKVDLKKINIGDFTPFFVKSNRLEGLLTGNVTISDPLGKITVEALAEAEQFRLDNDSIGKIEISTLYELATKKVKYSAISDNDNYNFDLSGVFNTIDSTNQQMDMTAHLRNTNINLLERYLDGVFTRVSGKATGELRIVGPPKNLKYLGKISLKDAGMMVDYTRCYYKIPNANFELKDGLIDFGTFTIRDTLNNTGEVVDGKLYHQGFSDMVFDFKMRSNRLLVLNTKPSENKQFYGSVIGKVNMSLTGPTEDIQMDIKGEPVDSSKIYLPIGSTRETGQADFVVWKVYGREMQAYTPYEKKGNLTVNLDLTANDFAKVYVILDELTGDIIAANGNGNLKIHAGTRDAMTMNGRLDIDEGFYVFTFQSIQRRFILSPESGNSIVWNGDPYQARLDINAVYEAENVRFSDLLTGTAYNLNPNVNKYRGKVLVIANITDRLTSPKISFKIELPQGSPILNDPDAAFALQLIQRDENELNKQVSFLILLNQFSPLSSSSSTVGPNIADKAFEGLFVNSISGFLSSVLTREASNILQKFFNDKSLRVNISASLYNGSNLIDNLNRNSINLPDRTNFNFSIEKGFFNERLTFVFGSALDFGLNSRQSQAAFQFLPDVTAEYKLTPDGKFLLTFFYKDNYSYISNRPLNRSGASISYRRQFDRIDEVFGKKKKPVRDTVPVVPATVPGGGEK